MAKYRKVMNETENVSSTNCRFPTKNHCEATYEQKKRGFFYFPPKQIVESDGILTLSLQLYTFYSRGICEYSNSLLYFLNIISIFSHGIKHCQCF